MTNTDKFVLEKIAPRHSAALLLFERDNAPYFEEYVPTRPAEMLTDNGMAKAIDALVDEMDRGEGFYFVALDVDEIVGRLNITFEGDAAEVGYRVGQATAGHGLAGWMLEEGINRVKAYEKISRLTGHALSSNPASIRVLERANFNLIKVDVGGGAKVGMTGDIHFFERQI